MADFLNDGGINVAAHNSNAWHTAVQISIAVGVVVALPALATLAAPVAVVAAVALFIVSTDAVIDQEHKKHHATQKN